MFRYKIDVLSEAQKSIFSDQFLIRRVTWWEGRGEGGKVGRRESKETEF